VSDAQTPDIDDREDPRPAHGRPFVPDGFQPPAPPSSEGVWLEPLGPEHNEADHRAWSSSIEHIHATPGFEHRRWPHPMTLDENLDDLRRHARHFEDGVGFTYTVRESADGDVVGCVYLYPSDDPHTDVDVRSWVRESHAPLDQAVAQLVAQWLRDEWPFQTVDYR
jgi:RimJ/RimL family protein N-acetyltransferase